MLLHVFDVEQLSITSKRRLASRFTKSTTRCDAEVMVKRLLIKRDKEAQTQPI